MPRKGHSEEQIVYALRQILSVEASIQRIKNASFKTGQRLVNGLPAEVAWRSERYGLRCAIPDREIRDPRPSQETNNFGYDRFANSSKAGCNVAAKRRPEQGRAHDADSAARPRSRDRGLF